MFVAPFNSSRRHFLTHTSAGFGALALAALQRFEAASAIAAPPVIDPLRPFAPRQPSLPATAKSVIFLFILGGPVR